MALPNQLEREAYIKPIQRAGVSDLPTMPSESEIKGTLSAHGHDQIEDKTDRIFPTKMDIEWRMVLHII